MSIRLSLLALLMSIGAFAQYKNVLLPLPKKAKYRWSQVEPAIAINPKNTNEVIAGSVMNDYYYSEDGGLSWTAKSIKSKVQRPPEKQKKFRQMFLNSEFSSRIDFFFSQNSTSVKMNLVSDLHRHHPLTSKLTCGQMSTEHCDHFSLEFLLFLSFLSFLSFFFRCIISVSG